MKIRRKNTNLHMPGDTEKTPAEISSSVSSIPPFAQAHELDTSIRDQENEGNLEASVNIEDFLNLSGETCEQEGNMGSVDENGKDLDKIAQIGGLAKCGSGNDEVGGGGIEVDDEEKEDEGDKKHEFSVGKYVWGKVIGNPWWPGQIYDPSDASDYAKKRKKGEKLLVAYFGDGSFSWCSLSQLKPFAENFETMSKQSTSRKLMHAVEEALNGIERIVESKTSCSCIPEQNRSALVTLLAVNAGIRQGALVPDSDLSEIPQLEPVDVFPLLKSIATNGSFTCKLKLRILKCWLSAFHRTNGRNELAVFNEIQVLEESEEKGSEGLVDVREAVLDPDEGPLDEDWTPMSAELEFGGSNQHWLRKCEGVEAGCLYQKRKTRSVSKLMKEVNFDEPNSEKENSRRDSKCGKRPANEEEDPSQSISTDGKKRQNGLKSLKQKGYKASAKFGVGEGQLVSEKKNKFLIEKADKSTTGETENVSASRDKREARSALKDSKGKTVDHARGDLASPLSKTTRKRKKNATLDEVIEKNENAINGRTKKVSSTENDEREEPENVAAKVKKYGTEKVDKVPEEGEIENVVASREKRITRSSVKGSEGRSIDEDPSRMGKDVSSPLKNTSRKRKKNETLDKINEKKDGATNGSAYKIINIENYEIEETVNKPAMDKERSTEKVDKITTGESKHVAASGKKWRTRSTLKGSKGKSVDEALNHRGKDLSPPLQETAWKRKNNKMLDDILDGKEYARNGSSNKVTSSDNDEQEKFENLPAKDEVSDTEKVDKVGQGQTGNVAASEEKRTTRSSVKGSKAKNVDEEALSQRGENLSSPLQKTTMKRKRTKSYEMSEIMENKKGAKILIGTKNDAIKEKGNERTSRERKKSMYLSPPFINFASSAGSLNVKNALGKRMTRVASEIIGPTPTLNNSKEYLQDNLSKEVGTSVDASPNHQSKEKEKEIIDERLKIVADQNLRSTSTLNCSDEKLQDNVSNKLATFLNLFKDPTPQQSEKEKEIINERDTMVANEILRSTPTLNSSNQKLVDNLSDKVVTFDNPFPDPSPQTSKEDQEKIISSVQSNVSLKEVVSELKSAALNPLIVWDQNFLNTVVVFIFAYRNVNYLYGSYHKIFRNSQQGEEQKSVETGSELMKASEKDPGEDAPKPASLLVIFPPGFCLPSKTDLIAIFSKFGPVKELETDVSHESYSAMVVFLSYSDMEKAFTLCLENNPFGYAKVSYRLRYSAGSSKAKESLKNPDLVWSSSEFAGTCLLFIKQKLEIMTSIVDDCGGNMSSESMVKLQNEMKGLLDNISIVTKSTLA